MKLVFVVLIGLVALSSTVLKPSAESWHPCDMTALPSNRQYYCGISDGQKFIQNSNQKPLSVRDHTSRLACIDIVSHTASDLRCRWCPDPPGINVEYRGPDA